MSGPDCPGCDRGGPAGGRGWLGDGDSLNVTEAGRVRLEGRMEEGKVRHGWLRA